MSRNGNFVKESRLSYSRRISRFSTFLTSNRDASPTSPTTWLVSGKRQGLRVFFLTTFRVCEFDLVTEVRVCLAESFDVLLDV